MYWLSGISRKKGTTCALCKAFHNRVFVLPDQKNEIPSLPLHPNCLCKQVEITSTKELKRRLEVDSVTVRVGNSPGLFGIRADGLKDMISKLEEEHPNGGIKILNITNHSGNGGTMPLGDGDDLRFLASQPELLRRLKKLLAPNAVLDIRMCKVTENAYGKKRVQELADALGIYVVAYAGPVNEFGGSPPYDKIDEKNKHESYHKRFFPDPKPEIFRPAGK